MERRDCGEEAMNSEEMNKMIYEFDGKDNKPYESCIGKKIIPYIGWFWRHVDFDSKSGYCLGVLPAFGGKDSIECNDEPKVGFMVNNKWGYYEFHISERIWKSLKGLIIDALKNQTHDNFKAVDGYMQSLLKGSGYQGKYRKVHY